MIDGNYDERDNLTFQQNNTKLKNCLIMQDRMIDMHSVKMYI